MNGRQLRILFRQFNKQYFGGRIPPYQIHVVPHITWLGEYGHCNKEKRLIRIKAGLSDEEAVSTLLHEMAHAVTRGGHPKSWKKEMIKLREAGSPLMGANATVKLDESNDTRISRRQFRATIDYILMDIPTITLPRAIRQFICTYGGAKSVSDFNRRYPWARDVYRAAKMQRAEFESRRADS